MKGVRTAGSWRTRRPLAWACLAGSGAVLLGVYFLAGWQLLLSGGLFLFCGLAACLRRHRLVGAALLAAAAGFWLCWCWHFHIALIETVWPGRLEPLALQALDYAQETAYGLSLEAKVLSEGPLQGVHLYLYLNADGLDIHPGDTLQATVKLFSALEDAAPWTYSNYANGIFLQGSASSASVTAQATPWNLLPQVWAYEIGQSLQRLFPEETAGFLFALTTGNKYALSSGLNAALTNTGLRHIVAASGLHLNLLMTVLFLLPGSRRGKGLLLLPALLAYAALAGFTPSICRAAIMQAVLLLAPLLEREEDGLTSLALALAVILCSNPYAIASVSLQLSFGAMLGLLVFCPALRRKRRRSLPGWLWDSLVRTLGANVFTLPLVLYYFGSVSLLTPVSNLAVLWVLPVLLPMGMVCALAGWGCPGLAALLALPTGWVAGLVIRLIDTLARIPNTTLSGSSPVFLAWIVLAYLVGSLLYFGCLRGKTTWAAIGLLLAALVSCFWTPRPSLEHGGVLISLLDVGQGQCILIATEAETAVIDCGSSQPGAEAVLEEAMTGLGRDTIDLIILTHYDSDHTNGVPAILEAYTVGCLVTPAPEDKDTSTADALWSKAQAQGTTVSVVDGEVDFALDHAALSLTPIGEGKNSGLAILTTVGAFDLLVTGDADIPSEEALLECWALPQVEVLVAGHHGSKYATGTALLEAICPETVLISVGDNHYGHPTAELLERCQLVGAQVYRTDESGTLTIAVQPGG